MSAPQQLTPAEARFIRKAVRLRQKFSNKALAAKFGVTARTITQYARRK